MKIEFTFFIGWALSLWIIFIFFVYLLNTKKVFNIEKNFFLTKKICEICYTVSFLYPSKSKYWRCWFCGSINKENDNRNRDSSR
ncbi:MAG: hypothetical protein NC935_00935 [Candidatus Omnitrophica bacterium]|nr:hypothetical protein [Candidatus Omnitrophota bacterium]